MKYKLDKKKALYVGGAVVFGIAIYLGYGSEFSKVSTCVTTVKKFVTAEYSDTECGTDFDGNFSCDTDYWSEPASDVFQVVSVNGDMTSSVGAFEAGYGPGYYYPPMPEHDTSMNTGSDFDSFRQHNDSSLTIVTNKSRFTEPAHKTSQCLDKIGGRIKVKTWYGISYGTEFNLRG